MAVATDALREATHLLEGRTQDYDPLLDLIGDAHFVLLGEATHGTHEFYRSRADITMRLIEEKGFNAVAVEADWPDAYRVNRFVRGARIDENDRQALGDFKRFPLWMWRNTEMLEFTRRLREHNDGLPEPQNVGFYGLDLYSLYSSMEAVVRYLDKVDPEAARRARYRYSCFEDYGEDPQSYGYAASFGMSRTCEDAVVEQLRDLQRAAEDYLRRDGFVAEDELFFAQQNARLARNAEEYYRSMFSGRDISWNLRDRHMAETLGNLSKHLSRRDREARIVVWEHNSHVGDARATEMSRRGELNVGELARRTYGHDAVLVGFTTYAGTVSAASGWDQPVERKRVRPGIAGSVEEMFHATDDPAFLLPLRAPSDAAVTLKKPLLERAIGVIYRPETERLSHYFFAQVADQFDAVIHFDQTQAVEPLDLTPTWEEGEAPETFPTGL